MNVAAAAGLEKLVNMLGRERAEIVVHETLERIGLTDLLTPDDYALFATDLMKQGGVLQIVGSAMRIQASLHGARQDTA